LSDDVAALAAIRRAAEEACAQHDAAHDVLHLARVVMNARALADAESSEHVVDRFVIEAAGWLHDLVQLPKGAGQPGESARKSAVAADELLASSGVVAERRARIRHAIEAHSFSGNLLPDTLEAAIVQDADRLDALGAIGIARLWVSGVALGGRLYSANDPAARERALDDRSFGLDHIERKLLRLPATMNTSAGRREAERRAAFVATYRAEFLRELGAV
jgi:uncharacterized protein